MRWNKTNIPSYLFLLFAIVFLIAEYSRIGDFKIFLLASESLANGEDIYVKSYVAGFKYFYSPLFALLIRPLTHLPEEMAGLIWNLAGFIMLARIFRLIHKMFFPELKGQLNKIQVLTFAAMLFPIYGNLHATQMTIFVLFCILESLYLITYRKQVILGALILALAINIKILPIVIIPYLIYRAEFKALTWLMVCTALFLILPALVLGWSENVSLHSEWFKLIDPTKSSNIIDLRERGLSSITSLVSSLMTDYRNPYELDLKRNILNADEGTVSMVINSIRAVLILMTLYVLRTLPFKSSKTAVHRLWEVSYICLLIPLIFPHQQLYAFFLILPAVYYIIHFLVIKRRAIETAWKRRLILVLAITSFLIINLELILGLFRHYFWYYKTLTYGVLLLLVVLLLCDPFRLKTDSEEQVDLPTT